MSRIVTLEQDGKITRFEVTDVDAWTDVAAFVRSLIRPNLVIALTGPLGAGKTTFVQALARELGIERTPQSPTFALLRSYRLPKPVNGVSRLVHVDAYRIDDERDILPLDLDAELEDGKTVLVVEWAEKVLGWLQKRSFIMLRVKI